MDKKYLLNVLLYFISGVLAIALIVFVVYHLAGLDSTDYMTATAVRVKADLGFEGDAYMFTQDVPVTFTGAGVAYSTLADGENVRAGGEICGIYGYKPEVRDALLEIDRMAQVLSRAEDKQSLTEANAAVRALMRSLREKSAAGTADGMGDLCDELASALGRRSRAAGERVDFEYEKELLSIRRRALTSELGERRTTLSAPASGNYYHACDGYEAVFTYDRAEDLDPGAFSKLIDAPERADLTFDAGKIRTGSAWRLVILTASENAVPLVADKTCTIRFSTGEELEMTLEKISADPAKDVTLLTFSTLVTPATDPGRCDRVKVISHTAEGLMIPGGALRVAEDKNAPEGQVCVYVLRGNKIQKKKVEVITKENGCFIVKDYTGDKEHPGYLQLNDQVITAGSGIAEGYAQ